MLAHKIPAAGILTCGAAGMKAQRALSPSRSVRVVNPGVEIDRFLPGAKPQRSPGVRRALLIWLAAAGAVIALAALLRAALGKP